MLELACVSDLLEKDGHDPDRKGGRAGAPFMGTDRVRDMVLKIGARHVPAVPAGREHDLDANPIGTGTLGEFIRLCNGLLVVAEAMVVKCLVRGIRAHRPPGSRAGDHAETLGELVDVSFSATVQVVDGPG